MYFTARGSAECIRFVFAQAEVTYEDKRFEHGGDEWAKVKPSTPSGMLPILEVDGKQLIGSGVIVRFLAEKFNLAGNSEIENVELAGILDVLKDFLIKVAEAVFVAEADKAETKKKVEEEDIPKYWGILEGMIKKNNSPDGFIYGMKPTYVDFCIYCTFDFVQMTVPNFFEQFPVAAKLKASVEALPNIAKWIKERPQTQY
jgi:glutathione S-transferase